MSSPGTYNRWFTIDADAPDALARRLRSIVAPAGQIHLDSCLFIEVDAEGASKISSMVRSVESGWDEILSGDLSMCEMLEGLDDLFVRRESTRSAPGVSEPPRPPPKSISKSISEPASEPLTAPQSEPLSEPESQPEHTLTPSNSPERRRRPSPMAGIISPQRAGRNSRSTSAFPNADTPPEEPTVNSDIRPLGDDFESPSEDGYSSENEQQSEPTRNSSEHPIPDGMSLDELLMSDEIDQEELLRQSGEIDLQAFVEARNERRRQVQAAAACDDVAEGSSSSDVDAPPGLGLEYSSEHAETNIADGAAVDAMLAEMSRSGNDGCPPQFPDVDHSKLTPLVRDETTALTAVDMERIRESAHDDVSWLLQDDFVGDASSTGKRRNYQQNRPEVEQATNPARPIWDADPASTDEISQEDIKQSRSAWSETNDSSD